VTEPTCHNPAPETDLPSPFHPCVLLLLVLQADAKAEAAPAVSSSQRRARPAVAIGAGGKAAGAGAVSSSSTAVPIHRWATCGGLRGGRGGWSETQVASERRGNWAVQLEPAAVAMLSPFGQLVGQSQSALMQAPPCGGGSFNRVVLTRKEIICSCCHSSGTSLAGALSTAAAAQPAQA
jgi:hypothetical protein